MTGSTESVRVVVMGVSAAGKSSVGSALAVRLGVEFADADDLHSSANRAKMAAGIPLTDDDRGPWLDSVGRVLADASSGGLVIACSALRRIYRDRIRQIAPDTFFVYLDGDPLLLAERASSRTGHFMPASLLASQLATLEPLAADELGVRIDVADSVDALAERSAVAVARAASWPR